MFRIKVMLTLLLALGLPLLAGCDNSASQPAVSQPTATPAPVSQPPVDQATTIKLAKAAAAKLQSPPRIYNIGSSYINRWPNAAGAITTTYSVCGAQPAASAAGNLSTGNPCTKPMTLTTEIAPTADGTGQSVTFRANWQPDATHNNEHSWQFEVGADQQVKFVREEGNTLPPMVQ